ncbi:MAG: SDR family NAD(P)-dependent oxidoreductase, partial [Betaproteobacteria bacterium]
FDAELHHQLTLAVGLNYGPAFQAVDSGWVDGDSVWARLRAPEAIKDELDKCVLHPALLDCTLQLIIHAMRKQAGLQGNVAYVPVKLGRLIFQSGKGLPVLARADLVRCSPHSLSAHFLLFDHRGEVVAWLRDVRFRSVRLHGDAGDHVRFLNYVGIPQPNPLSPLAILPNFAENLQTALTAASRRLAKTSSLHPYTHEVEPLLDALCAAFALDALKGIADDAAFLSDARVEQLAAGNPASALLLTRLVTMLQEDDILERNESGWHFRNTDEAPAPQDIWNALLADHPGYFAIFHAVGRIGLNLGRVLEGKVGAESVLPMECTVGTMFAEALGVAGRAAVSQALQSCATQGLARLGEGQRLRIVEISHGMPTFAGEILAAIDANRRDYVIATDSLATRERCELAGERLPGARVQLFGADADGAARQAIDQQAARFQLAILVNDFARDDDAQHALEHAMRMLAPNGTLILLGTPSSRWMDLLFGATERWWTNPAAARVAPFERSAQYWLQRISAMGFGCKGTIPLAADVATSPYVIVADAVIRPPVPKPIASAAADLQADAVPRRPAWIVLADDATAESRLGARLAQQIEAGGGHVVPAGSAWRMSPGELSGAISADAASLATLIADVKAEHGIVAGIVHLYGLKTRHAGVPQAHSQADNCVRQVDRCAVAAALVQACEATGTETICWLVTTGAAAALLPARIATMADTADAPLWGMGRTLQNEPGQLTFRLVDMERPRNGDLSSDALVAAIARELKLADDEQEVVLTQAGERFVPRLRGQPRALAPVARPPLSTTLRLGFQFPGQLRNLRWEAFPREFPKADEIEIEVAATGLNFRDVMYALGLLSDEAVENGFAGPTLGLECSGVVIAVGAEVEGFGLGDRVVAFGPSSFSNHDLTKAVAVSRIPPGISFEAAATIPGTFFTAYYALHHLARLREGERILIHGAAGGVGVAAIQLAKHFGAEIFATAGSDDKRDFLRLLGVDHIFDSRSLAFADEILAITQGEGVDVVLNSLAGEAINRNLRILKPFGRFLELGKRDFYENTRIGLRPFRNNIAYFGIDADQLMQEQPTLTQSLFRQVMTLFEQGILHPLPYRLFEADEVVEAFRFMQQARQIGKIVVTYQHGIKAVHAAKPQLQPLRLPADATYLVTGGLGGFGLRTAQWLVDKGAKNLALISRRGPVDAEAQAAIVEMTARGVKVLAAACDVTDEAALGGVLSRIAATMPPLRGVVHAAVVIEDALIRNTHTEQIGKVFAPKILGALNLHRLTATMKLDFFVLYSSATTLFGNPGQGNYVAANAYLEALAGARRAAGLPALCVRWGAIEDAGFLARNTQIREALQSRMGGNAIKAGDALDILEELMMSDRSDLGVLELDWKALGRFLPTAKSPKFSELETFGSDDDSDSDHADDIQRLMAELSPEELMTTFKELLKAEIGEILRMPADKIDDTRSVYDMGLDSLMGVELALAIESRFGIRLPVMALSESPTIAKLAEKIIVQLKSADVEVEATPASELAAQVQQLAGQHAASVDTQAVERFAKEIESGQAQSSGRIIH